LSRAIDTNVLVYARRAETAQHGQALSLLRTLAEGAEPWGLPWPCVYEFLRVVTHPRVFHPPTPLGSVLEDLRALQESPSVRMLRETDRHAEVMERVLHSTSVSGNLIHDAHIVALLLEHGFDEIVSADSDLRRFPGIRVTNPFGP